MEQIFLWYRKSKRSARRQSTRAWVNRPGGWAKDETEPKEGIQEIRESYPHRPY